MQQRTNEEEKKDQQCIKKMPQRTNEEEKRGIPIAQGLTNEPQVSSKSKEIILCCQ